MCNGQFPRGATRDGFTMIELVVGIVGVGLARLIAMPFTKYRDLTKPARLVDFADASARRFFRDPHRPNRQRQHS